MTPMQLHSWLLVYGNMGGIDEYCIVTLGVVMNDNVIFFTLLNHFQIM